MMVAAIQGEGQRGWGIRRPESERAAAMERIRSGGTLLPMRSHFVIKTADNLNATRERPDARCVHQAKQALRCMAAAADFQNRRTTCSTKDGNRALFNVRTVAHAIRFATARIPCDHREPFESPESPESVTGSIHPDG